MINPINSSQTKSSQFVSVRKWENMVSLNIVFQKRENISNGVVVYAGGGVNDLGFFLENCIEALSRLIEVWHVVKKYCTSHRSIARCTSTIISLFFVNFL